MIFSVAAIGSSFVYSGLYGETWVDGQSVVTGVVITAGAWLWSMIDAPVSASRINRENGWTLAPFPGKDITVSVAGLSADGKTAPGIVFSWKF